MVVLADWVCLGVSDTGFIRVRPDIKLIVLYYITPPPLLSILFYYVVNFSVMEMADVECDQITVGCLVLVTVIGGASYKGTVFCFYTRLGFLTIENGL